MINAPIWATFLHTSFRTEMTKLLRKDWISLSNFARGFSTATNTHRSQVPVVPSCRARHRRRLCASAKTIWRLQWHLHSLAHNISFRAPCRTLNIQLRLAGQNPRGTHLLTPSAAQPPISSIGTDRLRVSGSSLRREQSASRRFICMSETTRRPRQTLIMMNRIVQPWAVFCTPESWMPW